MLVRKKRNPSGVVSVQIIDKSLGKYRVHRTVGSSSDPDEVERLVARGKEMIDRMHGQQVLGLVPGEDDRFLEVLSSSLRKVRLLGPELILGRLFDQIGFNQVPEDLFRHLVLSRLVFPLSKLKTVDYLRKYDGIRLEVDQIYRFLDKLHSTYDELVQQISLSHTLEVLKADLAVVFYDVTTLYFEAEREDDFRIPGFSKEGKHKHPQILIGLLVSVGGYPLAYELFEGNKFEGHTMIPVLEAFRSRFEAQKLVVVADSGLLSKANLQVLRESGYDFILGARIRKESAGVKEKILAKKFTDGQKMVLNRPDGLQLIVSYSARRAAKDAHNRNRGLRRLERDLGRGKLTKKHLNNRGYNKFLVMEGEVDIALNLDKIRLDQQWDGLKGYLTNSGLSPGEVIANYSHLWQIEKAFRISKTDLKIRPVYHRLRRRIEAHICIAFCAYKVYKELERQLKGKRSYLSPEKAIEAMKTIYGLEMILPQSGKEHTMLFKDQEEHEHLIEIFGI